MTAICKLQGLQSNLPQQLTYLIEPSSSKGLYAKVDIKVGELVIVPFAEKVLYSKPEAPIPINAIDLKTEMTDPSWTKSRKAYLLLAGVPGRDRRERIEEELMENDKAANYSLFFGLCKDIDGQMERDSASVDVQTSIGKDSSISTFVFPIYKNATAIKKGNRIAIKQTTAHFLKEVSCKRAKLAQ